MHHDDNGLETSGIVSQPQLNVSFVRAAVVMVSLHSSETLTKTLPKSLLSSILPKSRTKVTGAGSGSNGRSSCDSEVLPGFCTSARLCQGLCRQALLPFQVALRRDHRYGSRSWLTTLWRHSCIRLIMLPPSACPVSLLGPLCPLACSRSS
jgi:hypothetical protein